MTLAAGNDCLLDSFDDKSDDAASLRRMLLALEPALELEVLVVVVVLTSAGVDFSVDVVVGVVLTLRLELELEVELELDPLLTDATFLGGSEARLSSACC